MSEQGRSYDDGKAAESKSFVTQGRLYLRTSIKEGILLCVPVTADGARFRGLAREGGTVIAGGDGGTKEGYAGIEPYFASYVESMRSPHERSGSGDEFSIVPATDDDLRNVLRKFHSQGVMIEWMNNAPLDVLDASEKVRIQRIASEFDNPE